MTGAVGIDPGGRQTGVVARHDDEMVQGWILTRQGAEPAPDAAYVAEVLRTVSDAFQLLRRDGVDNPWIAVEGVVQPNPHVRVTNVTGLLGAAMVLGGILARFPNVIVVNPGGHGKAPLGVYPRDLCGKNEVRGTGKYRHVRSAWDIARVGMALERVGVGGAGEATTGPARSRRRAG